MTFFGNHLLHQLAAEALHIDPLALRDLALSRGWKITGHLTNRLVMGSGRDDLTQLHVPLEKESPDYAESMVSAIGRLLEAERDHSDFRSAIFALQHHRSDVIRFAVNTDATRKGDISIAHDVALREGARQALLASACSVHSRTRHHPRMTFLDADEFIRSCRTAATERGSYVAKFICPLRPASSQTREHKPFARLATELLLTAAHTLVVAIESNNTHIITDVDDADAIVSSNLCDALLKMRPETDGYVQLSAAWATVDWAPHTDRDLPNVVKFRDDYFDTIDHVRRKLRPESIDTKARHYMGTVEELSGDLEDATPVRSGTVVLSVLSPSDDEDRYLKARAALDSKDYKKAIAAHQTGGAFVKILGKLRRGTKVSTFEEVLSFEVINPPKK